MNKEYITLKQSCLWYKPWACVDRYLTSIILYDNNGIIFKTTSGWLEDFGLEIDSIEIVKPVKVKKIDLTKKRNFVVTVRKPYDKDLYYDLYLYVDNKDVEIINRIDVEDNINYFTFIMERVKSKFKIRFKDKEIMCDVFTKNEHIECKDNIEKIEKAKRLIERYTYIEDRDNRLIEKLVQYNLLKI